MSKKPKREVNKRESFRCFVLLLLVGFAMAQSGCGLGCLSCDTSTELCELCDFRSFYFLETVTGMCTRTTVPNCLISMSPGKCLVCRGGHFNDTRGQCNPLDSSSRVEHCLLYFGLGKCAQCEPKFFVSDNGISCSQSALENQANCEIFGDKTCLKCSPDFIFDSKRKACVSRTFRTEFN